MKYKKDILIILLILFTIIQGVIFVKIKSNKTEKSQPVIGKIENKATNFKDVNKDLKILKNCEITNIKRDEGEWIINIKLTCKKEDMIDNINLLDKFIIKKYNLIFIENIGVIDLELKSR